MTEAKLRVIYGDTDQMGVVYYANYFRYFEFARGEFFRERGGDYTVLEQAGYFLPVVDARCAYRGSARYEDLLCIRIWVSHRGRASFSFDYEIRRDGEDTVLAQGKTVHALINREGKPQRLPDSLLKLLEGENPRG